MTKVSDIYDRLHAVMASEFAGYKRIPDPYELLSNPEILLRKGYAIGIGNGSNTGKQLAPRITIQRDFVLSFCREHYPTQNDTTNITALEKELLEDQVTLIKYLKNNADLGGNCANAFFSADSGIQYLQAETRKFIVLENAISIEYFESST